MEKVRTFLEKDYKRSAIGKKFKSVAIFVSQPMDYYAAFGLPHKIKESMVVDTSPYIRPLAQLVDEWENYGLILINNNEAEMFLVSMGALKDQKRLAAHIMNKHKKGGWSQMRFNRLRREAIDHFQKKVREALEDFIGKEKIAGLLIAGPGEAKIHFKNSLTPHLKDQVLTTLDYDMDDPTEKLVEAATEEVAKIERMKSAQAVERLRGEILKGGQAVYGIKETVEATREGKAELLVLSKELKPRGWICENCQVVELGSKDKCPYCQSKTSEVDVLEEILEFAERAGTNIEFVGDNPMLEALGGVGAILRY
jgi:peptide chain release factor subunit 1